MKTKIASPTATGKFALAAETLAQARADRLHGLIGCALEGEVRGDKLLAAALSEAGILSGPLVAMLLEEWEGSMADHPLDLPGWQALVYTPPTPDSPYPLGWGPDLDPWEGGSGPDLDWWERTGFEPVEED